MKCLPLCILAIVYFFNVEVCAWERTAQKNCQRDYKSCRKTENQCQSDYDRCMQNVAETDMAFFQHALTPQVKAVFLKLSDDRKKQAMDLADQNKMSPNDAVAEIASQCICPQKNQ